MEDQSRSERSVPSEKARDPNISTENQLQGAARRPSDTLDRESARDPVSGGAISSDYDPQSMTRRGEQDDTRAGRELNEGKGDDGSDGDRAERDPASDHNPLAPPINIQPGS